MSHVFCEGQEVYLIIVLKESDQPVGCVRINWMDTSHRFAWLRFTMGTERGKGFCKDALRSFVPSGTKGALIIRTLL